MSEKRRAVSYTHLDVYKRQVTNRMRTLLTTPAMEGEDKDVSKYDIELKSVTFGYNRDDVIKDVSFSIPAGSITALVGPAGSGKKMCIRDRYCSGLHRSVCGLQRRSKGKNAPFSDRPGKHEQRLCGICLLYTSRCV